MKSGGGKGEGKGRKGVPSVVVLRLVALMTVVVVEPLSVVVTVTVDSEVAVVDPEEDGGETGGIPGERFACARQVAWGKTYRRRWTCYSPRRWLSRRRRTSLRVVGT